MNCDPKALLAAARCYQCIPKPVMQSAMISLLCQWANNLTPPVFRWEPESAILNWVDSGGPHVDNFSGFNASADISTLTQLHFTNHDVVAIYGLSSLPALFVLEVISDFIGSLDCSNCTTVFSVSTTTSTNIISLNLSGCTALVSCNCSDNAIDTLTLVGCVNLTDLDCHNNFLDQSAVDGVICNLDSFGAINGTLNITGNTAPSPAGLVCSANLDPGKGWTVFHD